MLKLRVKQVTYESIIYTKRPKPKENQLWILGISARKFMHFAGNSAECVRSRAESCWGYGSIYKNTPKKLLQLYLVVQGSMQMEHSSHIVKVGVKATC